jgi:plasmid maintenance system killer protein
MTGFWWLRVNANWRVIFAIADGAVNDIDLVDYH